MALILVTPTNVQRGYASFDAPVDAASVSYAYNWDVSPVAIGSPSAVVLATVRDGGQIVDVVFNPPLTPGATYLLAAVNATTSGVALPAPDKECSFVAPADSLSVKGYYKLLEAFTWAFAEEAAYLAGRPETRLVDEVPSAADVFPVETTLGFPSTGRLWVGGKLFSYTGVQGASFTGVSSEAPLDGVPLSVHTWVALDLGSVP